MKFDYFSCAFRNYLSIFYISFRLINFLISSALSKVYNKKEIYIIKKMNKGYFITDFYSFK